MDNIIINQIDGVYRIEALGVVIEAPTVTIKVNGKVMIFGREGLTYIDDEGKVERHGRQTD